MLTSPVDTSSHPLDSSINSPNTLPVKSPLSDCEKSLSHEKTSSSISPGSSSTTSDVVKDPETRRCENVEMEAVHNHEMPPQSLSDEGLGREASVKVDQMGSTKHPVAVSGGGRGDVAPVGATTIEQSNFSPISNRNFSSMAHLPVIFSFNHL